MNEIVKNGFRKIKENQRKIRNEVIERTTGFIMAALGFVAALAWNDAIKTIIETLLPVKSGATMWAKLIYALLVTAIVIIITIILVRFTNKPEEKK
jgi:polyferredoxin